MVRPTDQETMAIEKMVCYSRFSREGKCHGREARVLGRLQRELGGGMWATAFALVSEGRSPWGRLRRFRVG